MIDLIRRAIDADRLARELTEAEAEISRLKKDLSSRLIGPSYHEVAQTFDATKVHDFLLDKVADDLAPMLERDVMMFLKNATAELRRGDRMRMTGYVAEDHFARSYEFRFETRAMGTTVRCMTF